MAEEDDPAVADEVMEVDGAIRGVCIEVRGSVTETERLSALFGTHYGDVKMSDRVSIGRAWVQRNKSACQLKSCREMMIKNPENVVMVGFDFAPRPSSRVVNRLSCDSS